VSTFEIKLLDIKVIEGQGAIEGDLEMKVGAIMQPGDKSIRWPDLAGDEKGYRKVPRNGSPVSIDRVIGRVSVAERETKTVTVDLRLTEVDDGPDDFGQAEVELDLSGNGGPVTVSSTMRLYRRGAPPKGKVRVRVSARPT